MKRLLFWLYLAPGPAEINACPYVKLLLALLDHPCINRFQTGSIPRQQGMIADSIYGAGIARRDSGYLSNCVRFENSAGGPGHLQTVFDVLTGFGFSQRMYVIVDCNPLPDGPVAAVHQRVLEFGLSDKKNVDQLAVAQLDVGKYPDLVQEFTVEALRLVDNQQNLFMVRVGLMEEPFQFDQKIGFAAEVAAEFEFSGQKLKKVDGTQSWIGDVGHNGGIIQCADQSMDQRGFACTHITGQQKKSQVFDNTVIQRGQGFFVFFPQPDKARARTQIKGFCF
ncbi:MAG: hypothetical protein R6V78_05225 [Desulfosarcina sp.]